jgi:HEPN domain-containing protein
MTELPDNNYEEARRWLSNTGDDLRTMRVVAGDPELPGRMACFLAHLVVEKCLKAVLIDAGVPFTKTHDLEALHNACLQAGRLEAIDRDLLASLDPWAIDGRYADDLVEADRSTATQLNDDLITFLA